MGVITPCGFKNIVLVIISGPDGKYKYTAHLRQLANAPSAHSPVDPRLGVVRTPLVLQAWRQALSHHPDREYAEYILKGIEEGFHTGVDSTRVIRPAKQNMQSARVNRGVISEYIAKQVEQGHMLGPFPVASAPRCISTG